MTRFASKLVFLTLVLIAVLVGPAQAEEKPINIALFTPIQIFDESQSIKGVRWNILYGSNQDVKGLDIGLVNRIRGDGLGVSWGAVGYIEGSYVGWQNNWITNYNLGSFKGLQTGFLNHTGGGKSWQWGAINVADAGSGFMLGFVNYAESYGGLQIGILNIIKSKESLPILPIVNWGF